MRVPWTAGRSNQSTLNLGGRTDAEASVLWLLDAKSRLLEKDPDSGKHCRLEEKGATEDEMVR